MAVSINKVIRETNLRQEIEKHAQKASFPPETLLLRTGQHVKLLPVVL